MAGPGPAVTRADILREEKLDVGVGYSEVQVKVGCVLVTADIQQAGDTVGGSYNRLLWMVTAAPPSTELMSSGSYCNHNKVNNKMQMLSVTRDLDTSLRPGAETFILNILR